MARPELGQDPRFGDPAGRRAYADTLDAIVGTWTRALDGEVLQADLQARNVAAHVVARSRDLVRDPQLAHRGHFVPMRHPMGGDTVVEGSRFVLSRTPAAFADTAPSYGADNETVLRDILGYDDDTITSLVAAGALE